LRHKVVKGIRRIAGARRIGVDCRDERVGAYCRIQKKDHALFLVLRGITRGEQQVRDNGCGDRQGEYHRP
jgi:hypothetical protein